MLRDIKYYEIVEDIIVDNKFILSKEHYHHRDSVYAHSLRVSYLSYKIARKIRLDYKSVARGALLHDFFLYDWRKQGKINKKPLFKKHGFTHANTALLNARKRFVLNKKEEDIISKHMFPLNIKPPVTPESWLVMLVDKYVAMSDYINK